MGKSYSTRWRERESDEEKKKGGKKKRREVKTELYPTWEEAEVLFAQRRFFLSSLGVSWIEEREGGEEYVGRRNDRGTKEIEVQGTWEKRETQNKREGKRGEYTSVQKVRTEHSFMQQRVPVLFFIIFFEYRKTSFPIPTSFLSLALSSLRVL